MPVNIRLVADINTLVATKSVEDIMAVAVLEQEPEALIELKRELACGYRILGQAGLGLGLLAHLSARLPGATTFWHYQLGQSVEEVRVADLREVGFDAKPLDGRSRINPSIRVHGDVYAVRPDVRCIVHHHGDNSVAMGAIGANLDPFDRNAGRWHDEINIAEDYESPEIANQGQSVVSALGARKALILKHHGVLVTGRSIRDAVVSTIELERSFGVQLKAMAAGRLQRMPQPEIDDCKKFLASDDFVDGTWNYLRRVLSRAGLDRDID
jgi:L-fuculose-phosphate aldolase